jgi:hypothetical protein
MPPMPVMAVAALAAVLWWGGDEVWNGAKKAGHKIAHVFKHGVHPKK